MYLYHMYYKMFYHSCVRVRYPKYYSQRKVGLTIIIILCNRFACNNLSYDDLLILDQCINKNMWLLGHTIVYKVF